MLSAMYKEICKTPRRILKSMLKVKDDENGVALMMAIFTVTMLMVFATEIMYETSVELVVSSQEVNRLKAHYAAKAGIEISLLRIFIYQKAVAALGSQIDPAMLDPIWQFPFSWPPIVPETVAIADKDEIKASVKTSTMDAQYLATIESEGSRININDLSSKSKFLAQAARTQIMQIFQNQLDNDQNFASRFRGFDFNKLINNIADWTSDGPTSLNGGTKAAIYGEKASDFMPPNQPFKTIEELHMVHDMTDELYDLLAPRVTIFGDEGINVNYADKGVLMSLTPLITDVLAQKIIDARSGSSHGPFKDEKDFVSYLNSIGIGGDPFKDRNNEETVPLIFDAEYNFRIRSTGIAGKAQREITVITFDFNRVKSRLQGFLTSPSPSASPGASAPPSGFPGAQPSASPSPSPSATPAEEAPTGPPTIVYWNET